MLAGMWVLDAPDLENLLPIARRPFIQSVNAANQQLLERQADMCDAPWAADPSARSVRLHQGDDPYRIVI
jgi:hypothetical protein